MEKRQLPARIISCFLIMMLSASYSLNLTAQTNNQPASPALKNIAFFYGNDIPVDLLHNYDYSVIGQPDLLDAKAYNDDNSEAVAYISLGEIDGKPKGSPPKHWALGKNTAWHSVVVNLALKDWKKYYIKEYVGPLWKKGYRTFFLDTLDSYYLAPHADIKAQQQGLIQLILAIKKKYPQAKLIFNRGFEILPQLHQVAFAVTAESLFRSWDAHNKRYVPVSSENRAYLLSQFKTLQKLKIPVIAVDYLPSNVDPKIAKAVVDKITALKIIPWVGNAALTNVGYSNINPQPREILMFYPYDPKLYKNRLPMLANANFPLEYLGYVPKLTPITTHLPTEPLNRRYAGIVVWDSTSDKKIHRVFANWLNQQRKTGLPIAFLGSLDPIMNDEKPNAAQGLANWQIKIASSIAPQIRPRLHIQTKNKNMDFEAKIFPNIHDFSILKANNSDIWLSISNQFNEREDAVAITPWGGYALNPYLLLSFPNGLEQWKVNPFQFYKKALRLQARPIPETTTENGRRLMMVHIDGDGFPSVAEWSKHFVAGAVMKKQILEKYKIPTDVSIIESEISPEGFFPSQSSKLMKIAQQIFALPWIEIATHTYSHPFDWQKLFTATKNGIYNLPVPNTYHYNIQREITGSTEFIDRYLAPKNKPCNMIFWSGEGNVTEPIVKLAYHDNLNNINGNAIPIKNHYFSIAMLVPLGVFHGPYFQVFATTANEANYTNNWTGPFYGFTDVIEAFQLTEKPRRTKPIDIYYHFYSASKLSSLKALKRVYDWALKQNVFHAYEREYTNIVLDFNRTAFNKKTDNEWIIRNHGYLKELRIPNSMGYPDLQRSKNITGYFINQKNRYVHLGPASTTDLYFILQPSTVPYLIEANATVTAFERTSTGLRFSLKGYVPLRFTLANTEDCILTQGQKIVKGRPYSKQKGNRFSLPQTKSADFLLSCTKKHTLS